MKRDGNICKWHLLLGGCCFLNGSLCCNPFSIEGCDIQCRDIFKDQNVQHKHYEPDKDDRKLTKSDIWKLMKIKRGDMVGDWFVPYREMKTIGIDPEIEIYHAIKEVKDKFKRENIMINQLRIFHNVELFKEEYGVYIIGIG